MKRFIISIIIVAFSFMAVSSALAQNPDLNVPVPSGKTQTTKSPDLNVPVPNKSTQTPANVYRTYRTNTTVVKKYSMNGVDKDARAENNTQNDRIGKLEKNKANSDEVNASFSSIDDRFAAKDQVDARQDRELGYTFWAFIIIPSVLLVMALLYFIFGGRNNNVHVIGGGYVPAYVPQAQPVVQPMPYYQPVPAAQPMHAANQQPSVNVPISIAVEPIQIDLRPSLRGAPPAPAQ